MTQIKDIILTKTVAAGGDFLIMQSAAGETYKITKGDLLVGLSSGSGGSGGSGDTTASDPYFLSVAALLHFNGENGSNIFTDQIGNIPTIHGTPVISTSKSKYGGASALFSRATSDYLVLPQMNFGTGDFTIETWIYPTLDYDNSTGICGQQEVRISMFGSTLTFWQNNGFVYSFGSNPPLNTWTHLAISRNSGIMRLFMNGALINTQSNAVNLSLAGNFNIGKSGDGSYPAYWTGYLDDFRITLGVGRYTADFTPSISAFPDK